MCCSSDLKAKFREISGEDELSSTESFLKPNVAHMSEEKHRQKSVKEEAREATFRRTSHVFHSMFTSKYKTDHKEFNYSGCL